MELLAVSRSAQPAIYAYATQPVRGLYRSTDAGATWKLLAVTDGAQPTLEALVVHSSAAGTVYVAGSLEAGGVWKSIDQGDTWKPANDGLPSSGEVSRLFLIPGAPETLYARVGRQVNKTSSGGASWALQSTIPNGATYSLNLTDPREMYYVSAGSVAVSTDEGLTYLGGGSLPLGPGTVHNGIRHLVVDPVDTNRLYATIVVYLTGLGALDNPVGTNTVAPGSPFSRPTAEYSVTVGGVAAEAQFLGLTPSFIGLAQANVVVPDMAPGDHPLVITIDGNASNSPVISVE